MAFLVFALGFVLLVAGLAGGYVSLDLLPTSLGVLYALGGAVALCAAILTFVLGVVIRRIDALAEHIRQPPSAVNGVAGVTPVDQTLAPPLAEEPSGAEAEAADGQEGQAEEPDSQETEEPVNENRSGHLPTLGEIEQAIETPEAPPSLIGRYSSGGASYMIFADGSIEAETRDGTFRFASMGDFKHYLAGHKGGKR
jgi:hypothetical protein